MDYELNHLDQPVGLPLHNWRVPPSPERRVLEGRLCRLEPLDPTRHARSLFDANALDPEGRNWTYLPYGPFASLEQYRAWIEKSCSGTDPLFYTIVDLIKGEAMGVASYLRISPETGSIEIGHLNFSPLLQRRAAATEALYLMMRHAFDLGYRRLEWKCNALNTASRAAAQRLGLSFEGIFRQSNVVKGRNRDTAWYAAIDSEWPEIRTALERWLAPSNFDERGEQRSKLSDLTAPILKQRG
jgi:RimJ/RimL family protein N-acetyltransferase